MEKSQNKLWFSYLEEIVNIASPSGFEKEAQGTFMNYAKQLADTVVMDTMGNVIAHKNTHGKPKLMLSAHIDEVGFMVKYIDDDGYLYIVPIGGIDTMLLPGLRLAVHHNGNAYLGIMGRRPIHLLNEMERSKFSFEDLWLDCGFSSKKHATKSVAVGDAVTFTTDLRWMSDDLICTRSADNKVGNSILLAVMSQMADLDTEYDIYFVSTTQEEIGLRGVMAVATTIKPDCAIIIDATDATDYPSVKHNLYGEVHLGCGPSLCVSPDIDRSTGEHLQRIASENNIPIQLEAYPNTSSTEARAVQIQNGGIKTSIVSFPVRYMHSPCEIVSALDIENAIRLISSFCISR